MRRYRWMIAIGVLVLLNVALHFCVIRWDMTDDKRYSLSEPTRQLLKSTDGTIDVTLYLTGDLNSGFKRLRTATTELTEEMGVYADIHCHTYTEEDGERPKSLQPIVIHERQKDGKTAQTPVYPYAVVRFGSRSAVVSLLKNNRGMSGEENLNISIENLEYAFAEAIHSLMQTETPAIAFLEGHGELPEQNVYDISTALNRYFQIDRGVLGSDPHVLDAYKVVIVADPQLPFSDRDKYIIDQYIMRGGRVLWLLNGVQFSDKVLAQEGFTPALPLDLHLTDMLFRYGVRINPALLQDVQCLPIAVNVSADPTQTNLQPMPWYYAPLLLTSQVSPITRNVAQVSSVFASPVDVVGGEDGIKKEILLATSSASRLIATPAEVNLGDLNPDLNTFGYQFIPVAYALEGKFPSAFEHRMKPDSIDGSEMVRPRSVKTRQVVVGAGSIIRNETEKGQPLPVGYDRYTGMQFGNRDFLVNAVLYLADDEGLIALREKTVALRLLNDKRAHDLRTKIQLISTIVPIALLALAGAVVLVVRKKKYTR